MPCGNLTVPRRGRRSPLNMWLVMIGPVEFFKNAKMQKGSARNSIPSNNACFVDLIFFYGGGEEVPDFWSKVESFDMTLFLLYLGCFEVRTTMKDLLFCLRSYCDSVRVISISLLVRASSALSPAFHACVRFLGGKSFACLHMKAWDMKVLAALWKIYESLLTLWRRSSWVLQEDGLADPVITSIILLTFFTFCTHGPWEPESNCLCWLDELVIMWAIFFCRCWFASCVLFLRWTSPEVLLPMSEWQ